MFGINQLTRAKRFVTIAIAISASACGGEYTPEPVETSREPLADLWNGWTVVGSTQAFVGSPGACSTPNSGMVVLGRRSTGRYRMYMNKWRASVSPTWTELGTQNFSSRPACSSLDEDPAGASSPNDHFAIMGQGTDNKLYARTFLADQTLTLVDGIPTVDPPTPKVDWHAINSNTHYVSAPAATVAFGKLVVVARRDDGLLYLHRNTLSSNAAAPYSNFNWRTVLPVPALPSGWTAAGDPSIANVNPYLNAVLIVTRATAPGQSDALFQIYWQGVGNQSYFWDSAGSENTWQFLPTGSYVFSDPSVVASASVSGGWATVFVRGAETQNGTRQVYQGTGISWMWSPFTPIAQGAQTFGSSPAGMVGDSERCYEVIARDASNNSLYWSMEATGIYSCP